MYKISKDNDKFHISELESSVAQEKTIQTFSSYDKAKEMYLHLKSGGGFDGFTPDFFVNWNSDDIVRRSY